MTAFRHRMVPVSAVQYTGPNSVESIRTIIVELLGFDIVDLRPAARPAKTQQDNVVRLAFQELSLRSKDGTLLPVAVGSWIVTFRDPAGNPQPVMVFQHDNFLAAFEPLE